ncbi:MAG: XTP/dITP diphosphatase [Deltaproteobacteria bacterium]|nr:XTP/dITP diphosphatase [Deltaproteobacteria bacterium]
MKIVLATRNNHKTREIEALFKDADIHILSLKDFPNISDIVEDTDSFEGNALKKARAVAEYTKKIVMADDSGLQVDALNGKPGVYSSRYAGENASDEENNKKLLNEMKDIPFEKRSARYKCVIAVVFPSGEEKIAEGECNGFIAFEPKGNYGFGYDPIFYVPEYNKTMAEISPEEKNKISHRARAIQNIKRQSCGFDKSNPYKKCRGSIH